MLSVGPSSPGYTQVFTAPCPGLYLFVLLGTGELKHNSDDLNLHSSDNGQKRAIVYMAAGDTLSYTGSTATLAGALLGDILEDP